MTNRRELKVRLSPQNYLYLSRMAEQNECSLNAELNRILREMAKVSQCDVPEQASP